jgi:copper homeostasis protein
MAQARGATSVELCSSLEVGGITPSYGEIYAARKAVDNIALHVLIRPRAGDFFFSKFEMEAMLADIDACQKLGVDGVVIGCLTKDGDVDKIKLSYLVEAAQGLAITFNRAIDYARDPLQALEDVIEGGCGRILTSGGRKTAIEGAPLILRFIEQSGSRAVIMAGGGIRPDNILETVEQAGAICIHTSCMEVLDVFTRG